MNSAIVVRAAGTPTLRLATSAPPVAKTQLPNPVRSSTTLGTAGASSHHTMAVRNGWARQAPHDDDPDRLAEDADRRAEHQVRGVVARRVGDPPDDDRAGEQLGQP